MFFLKKKPIPLKLTILNPITINPVMKRKRKKGKEEGKKREKGKKGKRERGKEKEGKKEGERGRRNVKNK